MADTSVAGVKPLPSRRTQARLRLTPGDLQSNWYYVTTPRALEDLRQHGDHITYLVPFWYGVTQSGGLEDQSDPVTKSLAGERGIPIIAIVHNYASPEGSDLIHRLLTTSALRSSLVRAILVMLNREHYAGVNIDFQFVPPEDRGVLTEFVMELGRAISPLGYLLTLSVPAQLQDDPRHPFSGAFDYRALGESAAYLYVLAYDEHFSAPGPIASTAFVRQALDYAVDVVERRKIILGMAAYGYDWAGVGGTPVTLTHGAAVSLAERQGVPIVFDGEAGEPTFSYIRDGVRHIVWFENARSFAIKLDLARETNVAGIAVWRLGQEDPAVWTLIQH